MTTEGRPILAEYVRAGFALVPIPTGRKGPIGSGWNKRELCIVDPEIAEFLDGNVGLAHAYSGTCAIDIDDLALCVEWMAQRGIDLPELLNAPESVRIESRPGRAKLIYRLTPPLPSFKIKAAGLELRCASSTGLTMQDVLPPSIHPDTGKPYTWAGTHWSRLPPLPPKLQDLWQSLIGVKPKGTKPVGNADAKVLRIQAPRLRAMLDAMPVTETSYDEWLGVGMALHHETGGRNVGLMLWNDWSAMDPRYKGLGDLETRWRGFRLDVENPITLASFRRETVAAAEEFDEVPEPTGEAPQRPTPRVAPLAQPLQGSAREKALEALRTVRRSKMGTIEARISNVVAVLGVPEVAGADIALDEFQDAIMVSPRGGDLWRPMTDSDYVQLRVWLETTGNCEPIPHEMMRQAILLVAERSKMDTARLWLEGLKWDGVERIRHFCPRYFGTQNAEYERAVGAYLWTALAGRIMEPGCQADMVPVLIGPQGCGKSRGVQAMVPSPEHYVEVRLDEQDDALARKLRGVLVGEMAEMRGLRAAEVERVKAFITRTHEKWVPKYREFATNYPRRFIMVGTTNDEEFLPPDSEHRRWLPMHTAKVDVPAIRRDREQLWAEGLAQWGVDGIAWSGLDKLAAYARAEAAGEDAWEEEVANYVKGIQGAVRLQDILVNAVGLDSRTVSRSAEMRVGRILRSLGYVRRSARVEGGRYTKVWMKVDFEPPAE